MVNKTGVTRGTAVAYTTWVKRAEAHPLVAGRLAAGEISESVARTLCLWTDKLREDRREDADKILTDAAVSGLELADWGAGSGQGGVIRGPGAAAGDHTGRRRGAARGPDSGVCRRGAGRAGRPVGARRRGGHPDAGAALPRRAGRGDVLAHSAAYADVSIRVDPSVSARSFFIPGFWLDVRCSAPDPGSCLRLFWVRICRAGGWGGRR